MWVGDWQDAEEIIAIVGQKWIALIQQRYNLHNKQGAIASSGFVRPVMMKDFCNIRVETLSV